MNEFHITGKVTYINPNAKDDGQGLTITHYPDDICDRYFEIGVIVPKDKSFPEILQYDYLELKGHFVSLNKNLDPRKAKLVHVVDEIIGQVHE